MRKIEQYYEKIIVTKHVVEVFRYEKLNTKGGGHREGNGRDRENNYRNTQRQRRARIRQLVTQNFDNTSKFVTLTFDDHREFDIRDPLACNRYFRLFVMRLKYRYPGLKYVAVIEFQDKNGRGAVHYHMICNLPFIEKAELAEIWGGGFVKINAIDKVDNIGAYVVKYMTADMDDTRLQGKSAYLHSKGLEEPVELTTWKGDTLEWREVHESLKSKTPSYSAKYESANAGEVEYIQYNSIRK